MQAKNSELSSKRLDEANETALASLRPTWPPAIPYTQVQQTLTEISY